MRNSKKASLTLIILFLACACAACSRNESARVGDGKIVASINKYDLTVDDFKSEAKALPGGLSDDDFEKLKESLLDGIITKKVLIQEAQAQNFDKDKVFIKEIERYWEQALLKSLYNKKSQEIARKIDLQEASYPSGLDREAKDAKAREELSAWIEGLKARANIKKYAENLKDIKKE